MNRKNYCIKSGFKDTKNIALRIVNGIKIWFYTEFRGKKLECYFKQIPPKFPHSSENFVGMTRFFEVRRQMRRGRL